MKTPMQTVTRHYSQLVVPRTQTAITPRTLTVDELAELPAYCKVQEECLVVDRTPTGHVLREPVRIPLERVLAVKQIGLVSYIVKSFVSERPRLILWVFENQSLVRLARHFLRHFSGSLMSLYTYTDTLSRYSRYVEQSPDMIINDVKAGGNIVDATRIQSHVGFVEDYMATLQDEGLSTGRVHAVVKHLRTFYRVNGAEIKLQEPISRRTTYKDRAPQPEELARLLEISNLRERTIISLLALGGFRQGTLSKLQYRHVSEDLEAGRTPIHVHVEAELTKGKYASYDTFLGGEAAEYLRLYLDDRKRGSRTQPKGHDGGTRDPEILTEASLLITGSSSAAPRPITAKRLRMIVRNVYSRGGFVKKSGGRMFELRTHSLRKYFKTRLVSAGVPESHADYMTGHVTDTYNQVQSLGVEKLRSAYSSADLRIRANTKSSRIELIKEYIRSAGLNPEQILTREALLDNHATIVDQESFQLQTLRRTFRDLVHQDVEAVQRPG